MSQLEGMELSCSGKTTDREKNEKVQEKISVFCFQKVTLALWHHFLKMSDLTVKSCIDFLQIVLTELIKIATYKSLHIMLDEVLRLKNYVNSINDTSIKVGKILTILVNNYMILITSQGEDLTQTLLKANICKSFEHWGSFKLALHLSSVWASMLK